MAKVIWGALTIFQGGHLNQDRLAKADYIILNGILKHKLLNLMGKEI